VSIEVGGEILGFLEDLRGGLGVEEAGRQCIQEGLASNVGTKNTHGMHMQRSLVIVRRLVFPM
jgi:hypothetical protein